MINPLLLSFPLILANAQEGPDVPNNELIEYGEKTSVTVEMANPNVRGWAWYKPAERQVYVYWQYRASGLTIGDFISSPDLASHIQRFGVPYIPTEVACTGPNQLAVGGLDDSGDSIIEMWTFDEAPDLTVAVDQQTQEQIIPLLQVPVIAKKVVFRTASEGYRWVGAIFRNWAVTHHGDLGGATPPASSLFFYLTNVQELYRLSLVDGSYEKMASPTDSSVVLVPELHSIHFDALGDGVHSQKGGVYWLFAVSYSDDIVVLKDSDLDGDIDSFEVLTSTEWGAPTWSSSSSFSTLSPSSDFRALRLSDFF